MQIEIFFRLLLVIAIIHIEDLLVLFQNGSKFVDVATHVELRAVNKDYGLLILILVLRVVFQNTPKLSHIWIETELNIRLNSFKDLVEVFVCYTTGYKRIDEFSSKIIRS